MNTACRHRHRRVVIRTATGVLVRVMMCLDCDTVLGQPIGRVATMKERPLIAREKP
jgi:hypothetical protein